jgi:hypothetical protein
MKANPGTVVAGLSANHMPLYLNRIEVPHRCHSLHRRVRFGLHSSIHSLFSRSSHQNFTVCWTTVKQESTSFLTRPNPSDAVPPQDCIVAHSCQRNKRLAIPLLMSALWSVSCSANLVLMLATAQHSRPSLSDPSLNARKALCHTMVSVALAVVEHHVALEPLFATAIEIGFLAWWLISTSSSDCVPGPLLTGLVFFKAAGKICRPGHHPHGSA